MFWVRDRKDVISPANVPAPNIIGQQQEQCITTWWRHQMETFSALLALCAWNSPVPGEFPSQSPVTRSFDVFFDMPLNKGLSKQSRGWWFETPLRSLWRQSNDTFNQYAFYSWFDLWNEYHFLTTSSYKQIYYSLNPNIISQTIISRDVLLLPIIIFSWRA